MDYLIAVHGWISSNCSESCMRLWELIGVWLSSIGTLLAVVVSLALARRDRIQLKVTAGVRMLVTVGQPGPHPDLLVIRVRNVGSRPATVEGISWRRRPWRSLHAYQLFAEEKGHRGPPVTILPGEAHSFSLPMEGDIDWAGRFLKEFVGSRPNLSLRLMRVVVYTPAGDSFSAPLEPGLIEWLVTKSRS